MQRLSEQQLQTAFKSALAAMNAKNFALAVQQFEKILCVAPKHGSSHLHLGTLYTKGGKLDAAVTHLAAAAKQMPKEPAVHMQYGVALAAVGQYKKAVSALGKAEKLALASVSVLAQFCACVPTEGRIEEGRVLSA